MQRAQVFERKRMLLDRDVVQAPAAPRIAAPGAPARQEIEAEPEAGLEDDEALAPGPAPGQAVAGEEDVLGLRRPAAGAVVHVAVCGGVGRLVPQLKAGGNDRRGHGRYCDAVMPPST
jgi:hypothetical protein